MVTLPAYVFPFEGENFRDHVEYPRHFSQAECAAIIAMGKSFPLEEGTVSQANHVDETMRKSNIHWMEYRADHAWMWNKLSMLAQNSNREHFHFDIIGFFENIQFTEYETIGAHYDWHVDFGSGSMGKRKLSIVVQLSDPATYEGGDLQLFFDRKPYDVTRSLGTAVVFPSYTLHKVTPMTSGKRYSLVLWVSGKTQYK